MSYSAFFSLQQEIADTIQSIVRFYLPEGGTILDPTCGKENYQFSSWVKQMTLEGTHYEYLSSDLLPFGDVQAAVGELPFRDKIADVTVYDPPFTPQASADPRGVDYNIELARTISEIGGYYSLSTYQELARVTRQFIILRGQDFYYPPNTCNYYSFFELALRGLYHMGKELKLRALYPYRYNHHRLPLYRENLKNVPRPIVTHGYIAVLATPEAPEHRDGKAIKEIVMKQNWRPERQDLQARL